MAEIPEKIGKYEVRSVAGKGAMGIVYFAHDPFVDRDIAIKVCKTEDEDESTVGMARRMFFNEAKSAGALDHPNILHIYDAGEEDGQPYIVMEYVEGGETLKSYCNTENLLPVERVVRIMHQCAKALDYAHRRNVIHRDIKPANILLTRAGDAKIGDFGIAQRLLPGKTHLMSTFGSPRYMSPEQARDEEITPQADIYSLGVSFYELLTGQPPFNARGIGQLINMITSKEPTPVGELRAGLPAGVAEIVERAMHKDLAQRYVTGAEMAVDLSRLYDTLTDAGPPELSDEDRFKAARALRFFNEFSDAELREVLAVGIWERFPAGKRIISEGALEQSFYVIVSGEVVVAVGSRRIGRLPAGECIGELGYLSKVQRTASVIARDDVMCLKIDEALMDWASLPCQMRFMKTFQQTLIDRLSRTTLALAKHRT